MKIFTSILKTVLITFLAANVYAAGKLKIINRGMDGNVRMYYVSCPDGETIGAVRQHFEVKVNHEPQTVIDPAGGFTTIEKSKTAKLIETCAVRTSGERTCSDWSVDQAAQSICR